MVKGCLTVATVIGLIFGAAAAADDAATVYQVSEGGRPAIAADDEGGLHMALEMRDKDLDLVDVFYLKSTDAARTWTKPVDISDPGKSSIADIAVEKNGAIDVAWSYTTSMQDSTDIFVVRSPNGGKSWATSIDISNTPGVSSEPDIAVGPDNAIHVVWKDTTSGEKRPEIYYSVSRDNGTTWTNAEKVSELNGAASEPAIAVGRDGVVHVAWESKGATEGTSIIYYAHKDPKSWSKALDVSRSAHLCSHPDIACGPKGQIVICWADNSKSEDQSDVWLTIGNKQSVFDKPRNVSNTPDISKNPALVTDEVGRVAIVWSDTAREAATSEIVGRVSFDGGLTLSNVMDFSNKEGKSIHPDVALAANKLFVVWEDTLPNGKVVKATCTELTGTPIGSSPSVEPKKPLSPKPTKSKH
jgi:hypothetical protein